MKPTVSMLFLLALLSFSPEANAGLWWQSGSLFHQLQEYLRWMLGLFS